MPVLNLPIIPVDGDNRDAVVVRGLLHDEAAPEDSLSIVNGLLDYENIDAGWIVGKEHTQRGSSVDMFSASRTANMDWSWRIFGTNQTGDYDDASYGDNIINSGLSRPIPGACREFHSKWPGYAIVMWSVFWASDNGSRAADDDGYLTSIALVANGAYVDSQLRHSGMCVDAGDAKFYERARVWSGHAVVPITAGFNSVGLQIIGDNRIRLTRTWASNIQVVALKYPGG